MDQYNYTSSDKSRTGLKQIIIIISALAVLLVVAVGLFKISKPKPGADHPVTFTITDADHVLGSRTAKTVLVEYSDFQCPFCKAAWPNVEQLHQDFGDSLLIVYRHFPLPQHKNSKNAAQAAEAAGKQGKFFEMAKLLFDHQTDWADSLNASAQFSDYAQSLSLNHDQFIKDMNSDKVYVHIQNDLAGGNNAGVSGTPTFYLNGKSIVTPSTYDQFKQLITQAIPK